MHELTPEDRRQISRLGISEEEVERQLELHRHPPEPAPLLRPATLGDGIRPLPEARHGELPETYERAAGAGRLGKFVPASGAASRMFRSLAAGERAATERFAAELERFAFAEELLSELARRGLSPSEARSAERREDLLRALLEPEGLGYLERPKALVPFHRAPGEAARTPFAEHLAETGAYARGPRQSRLHMTIAPASRKLFEGELETQRGELETAAETHFDVSFSSQSHATDTLAVDPEGQPFRTGDGRLLFRPGGHGALIWNLDEISGDVVFVKTIDNIVPEDRRGPTILWKKLLAGCLLELQEGSFEILRRLEAGKADGLWLDEGVRFAAEKLGIAAARDLLGAGAEAQREFLRRELDRPIRVCGMVINEGEPGGGPFWVRRSDGAETLQIVEKAEIDVDDPGQREILEASTHFNPVDLVCGLRNHRGEPHDLLEFTDPRRVFLARKSQEGRPLQALEHPGLWNGAMAFWNTVFVEVPATTFAPVKTVFDLLRPEHQPSR